MSKFKEKNQSTYISIIGFCVLCLLIFTIYRLSLMQTALADTSLSIIGILVLDLIFVLYNNINIVYQRIHNGAIQKLKSMYSIGQNYDIDTIKFSQSISNVCLYIQFIILIMIVVCNVIQLYTIFDLLVLIWIFILISSYINWRYFR